jgi:hypothetical protein
VHFLRQQRYFEEIFIEVLAFCLREFWLVL